VTKFFAESFWLLLFVLYMRAILVCLSAMNFDDQYFVPRIIIVLLCLVIVVIAYRQLKHK